MSLGQYLQEIFTGRHFASCLRLLSGCSYANGLHRQRLCVWRINLPVPMGNVVMKERSAIRLRLSYPRRSSPEDSRRFPLDIHIQPSQVSPLPSLDEEKIVGQIRKRGETPAGYLIVALIPNDRISREWKRKFKNTPDADRLP